MLFFVLLSVVFAFLSERFFLEEHFLLQKKGEVQQAYNQEGYAKDNNRYETLDNDAKLYFYAEEAGTRYVSVSFAQKSRDNLSVQVFYGEDNLYSPENSIEYIFKGDEMEHVFALPSLYSYIRVDIGNEAGITFELNQITFPQTKNPVVFKMLLCSILYFIVLSFVWSLLNKLENFTGKQEKILEISIVALCFFLYLICSLKISMEHTPDEYMRYDLPEYIYQNNTLPLGDEPEILDPLYGISYAYLPYLPSLIAVVFMKLASIVTDNPDNLVRAARLVSVLASTGTIWFIFKIGDKLFQNKAFKYMAAIFCGLLPQFVFLSSYFNNDAFSVFLSAMIIYAWLIGKERGWDKKSCILLGIGVGMCALTYYNAYGFILASILVFFCTQGRDEKEDRKKYFSLLAKRTMLIASIAFLIAGWFFIRNAIVYQGDFLGMNTMQECSELYAQDAYKPSNRMTPSKAGVSVLDMLTTDNFRGNWTDMTWKSFIGVFGYMSIYLKEVIYLGFSFLYSFGLLSAFFRVIYANAQSKKERWDKVLCGAFGLCIIVPIILSIRYSYTMDYQPQGRYIMTMLLPFLFFVVRGYEKLAQAFAQRKKQIHAGLSAIVVFYVLLFLAAANQMLRMFV